MSDRRDSWLSLLLLAATLVVYAPVRNYDFINFDDPIYVTANTHVQHGLTKEGMAWAFGRLHGEGSYWHPITWLSHMLDCELFGLRAGWHHLMNVLFHGVNTVLLFAVLRSLPGTRCQSWLVAGLFALHPLQVDTVAWVTERKNLLTTMFGLLTVMAYGRYAGRGPRVEGRVQRQDEERSTFNVQHSTFKARKTDGGRNAGQATEGRGPDNESGKSQQPQKHKDTEETAEEERSTFGWGWYAAALVFFALTLMAKPALMPLPFALLLLDFWPLGRMQTNEGMLKLARSGLRLLGEKVPFLILSILSGVITVWGHAELKALSLTLPLGMRIENAVVAYAGYIWKTLWPAKLAIFYPHPGEWPTMQVMGSGLLLMGLSAVALWNLWRRPYLAVGWFWFLGMLVPTIGLVQAGEQASADRFCYVPVIGLFLALTWGGFDLLRQRRLEATAGPVIMAVVLGGCALVTSLQVRHWKNPKTLFEHALAVTARNHLAHAALADVCVEDGDFEQARQHVATALEIMPGYAGALRGMGQVLLKQGKPEEALSFLDKALSLSPDDTTAVGFAAAALTALGRAGEAVEHYDRALKLKPDWPEALNNFAWLLATHPDPQIRNGSKAVELAERACQMTGNAKAIYLGTLAAAYAEANRFDDAVATAHRAEARAQAAGDSALAARNEELRRLYEAGSAFRQTP